MQRDVTGVVITHGDNPYVQRAIEALAAQTATTRVVANLPGCRPAAADLPNVVYCENERPISFATNVNLAIKTVDTPFVALVNPDAVADTGCIGALAAWLADQPGAAVAAPQLRWPDGREQPTGRSFPTVGATVVRRTPLRRLFPPLAVQQRHYRLDERTGDPWMADWLLGAFWLIRREAFDRIGGMDEGYPMYVEDMDFCARADSLGWQRWVVPYATAVHEYQAVIDSHFLSRRNWWHIRGMARFLRRHPRRVFVPATVRSAS